MKPLLIVDGYNILGAWQDIAWHPDSLEEGRLRLQRQLEDYAGYTEQEVVLVFDGYQSGRKLRSEERFGHLMLIFTKQDETADSYIERLVAQTPKYRQVRVATSDGLEQSQILATGATRMTSRELLMEMKHIREKGMHAHRGTKTYETRIESRLSPEQMEALEKLRRGKT